MEIVTNDMIPDGKFKNKYEAIKSIRECLKMLTEIRNKTSFVKLSASANVFRWNWQKGIILNNFSMKK